MKQVFFIILLSSLGVFNLLAQEEIKSNQDSKDIPEIYFEETTHDFGTMEYNGDGTCKFIFKNTGKEPLLLTNVKASCGCTTPFWPKQPIKKGEEGIITVKYNTKIIGSFTKSIRVYSNAKTNLVTLKITGTVEKKAEEIN